MEMWPAVSLIAGTIKRNHPFVDALFNDASLFSRPIEQGFQLLVDRQHYQQDLFINWNQIETFQKPERFDVGYAGRASAGFFSSQWPSLTGLIPAAHNIRNLEPSSDPVFPAIARPETIS